MPLALQAPRQAFTVVTDSYEYEEPLEGGTLYGTAEAFISHDTSSDSDYKANWNDTKSQWDLVSGKSFSSDKKSLGNSYSGDGNINTSGDYIGAGGGKTGSWSFSGKVHKDGKAKAGTGSFSKADVVDGKWKLSDEGSVTFADKIVNSSFGAIGSDPPGTFNDGTISGTYSRSGEAKTGFNWNIYAGLQSTTGDAKWFTKGVSRASSEGGGTIGSGGTMGGYTFNDSSESTDDGTINYTYDSITEQFNAKSGDTGETGDTALLQRGTKGMASFSGQRSDLRGRSPGPSKRF